MAQRLDLDPKGFTIEFTPRGRILKEIGSIIAFNNFEVEERTNKSKMEKYMRLSRNLSIASFFVSIGVLIGGIVAAAFYLLEINRVYLHYGLANQVCISLAVFFLLGCGSGAILWHILKSKE